VVTGVAMLGNGGALSRFFIQCASDAKQSKSRGKAMVKVLHIRDGLRLKANLPGQYLNFGVKVLTSDVNNSTSETKILDTTRW